MIVLLGIILYTVVVGGLFYSLGQRHEREETAIQMGRIEQAVHRRERELQGQIQELQSDLERIISG